MFTVLFVFFKLFLQYFVLFSAKLSWSVTGGNRWSTSTGILRTTTHPVLKSLVVALVLSRLDYVSATLADIPRTLHNKLQSILNARLIHKARKYDHVTPLLKDLHWLREQERLDFRLAVLVSFSDVYMAQRQHTVLSHQLCRVADCESRRRLWSGSTTALIIPSTIGDRAFPVAASRIVCHQTWSQWRHFRFFGSC